MTTILRKLIAVNIETAVPSQTEKVWVALADRVPGTTRPRQDAPMSRWAESPSAFVMDAKTYATNSVVLGSLKAPFFGDSR